MYITPFPTITNGKLQKQIGEVEKQLILKYDGV